MDAVIINENNIKPFKKIVWKVSVRCPYCDKDCNYTLDDIRFRIKEMTCNANSGCGKSFFIKR